METITIFTAGGSKGDPGPAAVGVYVVDGTNQVVLEHKAAIGNATDNFASYQAVAEALGVVQKHFSEAAKDMQFELKLDNEFVKKQLNGEDPITDPRSVSHFVHVHNLRVEHYPNLKLTHINRKQNTDAVRLVDEALDVE